MARDKTWAVVRREYLERVRSRWFVVATLLAPILMGGLLVAPLWLASRTQPSPDLARIAIVDATGRALGQRVALDLAGGLSADVPTARVAEVPPGDDAALRAAEDSARHEALAGRVKGYLVLEPAVLSGGRGRYVGVNAASQLDVRRLREGVQDQVVTLRLEDAGLDPELVRRVNSLDVRLTATRLTERGEGAEGRVSAAFAFGVAFVLYLTIFLYGQNVLRGVIEEKQSRVAEIVVSSIPAWKLLTGKVLGVGAAGMTQLLLSLGASLALIELRTPILARLGLPQVPFALPDISVGAALLLLLFFLLGYVFYAALFAAVGAMVSSENEAQQVALPVAMLLVFTAMFIQPVLLDPESPAAITLSLIPFSAPIMMPLRLSLIPLPAWDVASSVVMMLAGCYVVIFAAARIYRTGLLMYGKRPGLREIWRWVRYDGR